MQEKIVFRNVRVSFLGGDAVRVERGERGEFFDGDTFFIPSRGELAGDPPAYSVEGNLLRFCGYELYLPTGDTLSGLCLKRGGKTVYRYRRIKNSGELPPPAKTPEVFALADSPRILLPQGGYSASRSGEFCVQENAEDIYLLFARGDAKKLRSLYVALTGRCELVRRSTFGSWNSKYYAYTEEEAKKLIEDYKKYGVPLDVMVIDTDWRLSEGGWGYEVNRRLFPDLKRFFDFAHSRNVEIAFNDHPEPVCGAQVFDPREIAYRERNLKALMALGLDIWWYDRNWVTRLLSPTASVCPETFGLYLYHDVTKRFFQSAAGEGNYRRPVIMGNVVEITNGEYVGFRDSASHRYGVQWTGDIGSSSSDLAQEVENLVRCSENCFPYMSSDCGGHTGNPDKEQFIRWMQYGALSPIFRPHCTKTVKRTREPWLYDGETLAIVREYLLLRYRLLPYLYANAYEAYLTGMPIFRSLALEYPKDRRSARRDEYLLGRNILIAPVIGSAVRQLAAGDYAAPVEVVFFGGTERKGEPLGRAVWKTLAMSLRHEPPAEGVPAYYFSATVRTKIVTDRPKRLLIKNDDGATVYINGVCVMRDEMTHAATLTPLIDLKAGEEYAVEIEYFQAEGEAYLGLFEAETAEEGSREVYLPAGRWMDVFDGKVYPGRRTLVKKCGLRSMPLFVRLGALIPLAENAQNTAEQSREKLILDFYPDQDASDEGFLYEDDGETTAYKKGVFCKSAYTAEYLPAKRAFSVRLHAAEGGYAGTERREILLKYHLIGAAERVGRVCLNGKEIPFRIFGKADTVPFGETAFSPDGAVLSVRFSARTDEEQEILFFLK